MEVFNLFSKPKFLFCLHCAVCKPGNERILSHALEPNFHYPFFFFSVIYDKTLVVIKKEPPFLLNVAQNVASKYMLTNFAAVHFLYLSLEMRNSLEYHALM